MLQKSVGETVHERWEIGNTWFSCFSPSPPTPPRHFFFVGDYLISEIYCLCSLKCENVYKIGQRVFYLTGHVTFEAKYGFPLNYMASTYELLSSMRLLSSFSTSPCWDSTMRTAGRLLKNLSLQLWEEVRQPALWKPVLSYYQRLQMHTCATPSFHWVHLGY